MAFEPTKLFHRIVSCCPASRQRPTTAVVALSGTYPSRHQLPPLAGLLKPADTVEGLIERLHKLADDDTITTVVVRESGLAASLATCATIGDVLGELAQCKTVVASLQSVTMGSLLATAQVSEVTAVPSASVMVFGFGAEAMFWGAFLRKHGIEFENLRIKEYKSALTRFSEDHMDDHDREQLTAYLTGAEQRWVDDIAAGRNVPVDQVRGWLDEIVTSAAQACDVGMVQRVCYEDALFTPVATRMWDHLDVVMPSFESKPRADSVAVVPVMGMIVPGRRQGSPFGGRQAAAETVVGHLRRAKSDAGTKAIVLHVDSGGGSALASDLICHEIATSDKPVVAVMGSVAASGGYYVLAEADEVLASPYTITGSIGVVTGKPVVARLQANHEVNVETVGRTDALFDSASRPFTERQREWATGMMDVVYGQFVEVVARGRGLDAERVNEIGRGRIWSGADALGIGLIDGFGHVATAIDHARERGGLAADAPTWTPSTPRLPLPEFGVNPAETLVAAAWPFGKEPVLTWWDRPFRITS